LSLELGNNYLKLGLFEIFGQIFIKNADVSKKYAHLIKNILHFWK